MFGEPLYTCVGGIFVCLYPLFFTILSKVSFFSFLPSPFFLIFPISLNKLFLLSLAYFKLGTLWYPSFFYYMPNSSWILCCHSFTFVTCVLQGKVFFAIVFIISLPYFKLNPLLLLLPQLLTKLRALLGSGFHHKWMGP